MQSLERTGNPWRLLLRAAQEVIFAFHGYLGSLPPREGRMQGFGHMGFPSYFVYSGRAGFFGGCLLIVGLFTRVAGFCSWQGKWRLRS